jgi:hypothetical protein
MAFNNYAWYMNGIPRSQHISEYTNQILGMALEVNFTWRWLCLMHKLIAGQQPSYLLDLDMLNFSMSFKAKRSANVKTIKP